MSQYLSSLLGQKRVVDTLQKFIQSDQIPHAMLVSGSKNVGQHQAAKLLIKELLSKKIPEKNFNTQIDKLEEPVLKYVIPLPRGKSETPDDMPISKLVPADLESLKDEIEKKAKNSFHEITLERANNIKISSIRDIKKAMSINYDDLPYRLILIEEAHLMSTEAQNALLKSLEEPPKGVIFILISDKPEILLSTIKSRCWELPFAPLQNKDIEYILINNFAVPADQARRVIPFAEGSIHRVFELLNHGFDELLDVSINILRYSLGRKYNTAIKLFNSTIEENPKLVIPIIIQLLITWFNDVQKLKIGEKEIHFSGYKETIEKFIQKFDSAKLDLSAQQKSSM